MIVLKGIGVFKDISFGKLLIVSNKESDIIKRAIDNTDREIKRYKAAKELAISEIRNLYEKSLADCGASEAEIFAIHEMMIKDKDYENTILDIINSQKLNAEYAVWQASKKFSSIFENMGDSYMSARASDVKDISQMIINCLNNKTFRGENEYLPDEPIILFGTEFTPSEIYSFDRNSVKGFISSKGSIFSHSSIISKVLKIPSVVGVETEFNDEYNGKQAIIDGYNGEVYIDPTSDIISKFSEIKKEKDTRASLLLKFKGKKNITKDGKTIKIYANINNPDELDAAIENDAGGIGIFRSEFLYLGSKTYPTEDEQFEEYKTIVKKMGNKPVVIRTMDIGSDKKVDYFNLPEEKNPAMGYRAIRICLDKPEILITQLRAIYRASVFGNVSVMFPMVISVKEVMELKKIVKKVKDDLANENIPFANNVKIGIMIETPAAVFISDELAREVDFFSIGTNDLTQYSLAIDRQNGKVGSKFEAHHPAILRMIKMVTDNAHKNGIEVGICGELAADDSLTETFLTFGIDELSMTPSFILNIRKKVLETNVYEIKDQILNNI